jgi:two-component system CheB/CheR fusion protein
LDDLFETVDKKQKVFRRRELQPAPISEFPELPRMSGERTAGHKPHGAPASAITTHTAERVLLNHLAPPSVLVGPRGDIIYFHGRTGQFLEPPAGEPLANIHGMAREGLRLELQAALRQAAGSKEPVVRHGLQVKSNDGFVSVRLTARRLEQPELVKGSCIVTFEVEDPGLVGGIQKPEVTDGRLTELEVELQYTRENLQGSIEELETSNEELKSTNEELQSTNEELQSANEELETSREEMQSLNEELQTVNSELEDRNRALSQANDDMQNLLNSTEIATVFLDGALSIKRFTIPARKVFSLIDTDIGRPISDLTANLRYDGLVEDAREVLATLVFQEREIQTKEGAWRLMRLMPYRTAENVIDGLVITFVDIDRIRREERAAEAARVSGDDVLEQFPDGVAVLDSELRVLQANRLFLNLFHTTQRRLIGESIASAREIAWTVPALQAVLQDVVKDRRTVRHLAMERQALNNERHTIRVSAHRFSASAGGESRILLTVESPDQPEDAETDAQPVR